MKTIFGKHRKRAITPVIATLLMIAITVAAVAGFYIFYNSFIKQSKVTGDNPSITISGPSTADPGDTVIVSIRNSGNVDLASWVMTEPDGSTTSSGTGEVLKVGSQRSFAVLLDVDDGPPWTFNVEALTVGGSECEDILAIVGT